MRGEREREYLVLVDHLTWMMTISVLSNNMVLSKITFTRSFLTLEIDMDVDSFKTYEVDRLNVLALDYGMQAGAFSKYVACQDVPRCS